MKIIPYNKFEIVVPYTPEQISRRIMGITTMTSQNFYIKKVYTPFLGKVHDNGFKITQSGYNPVNGMYKMNSFGPDTFGKYKEIENGTVITVKQRLKIPVILVSSIWTLGVLLACVFMVLLWLSGESFDMIFAIPFVMLVLMIMFMKHCFWNSADEIRRILEQALL